VKTEFEVFKSTVWKPYRTAPVIIVFDYGIDDVRTNLQFIKDHTSNTMYQIGKTRLSNSMKEATKIVEENNLVQELKKEVITLWMKIEKLFSSERIPKRR